MSLTSFICALYVSQNLKWLGMCIAVFSALRGEGRHVICTFRRLRGVFFNLENRVGSGGSSHAHRTSQYPAWGAEVFMYAFFPFLARQSFAYVIQLI
jgi:hypothetical protein